MLLPKATEEMMVSHLRDPLRSPRLEDPSVGLSPALGMTL
jgi:hypothetical protein